MATVVNQQYIGPAESPEEAQRRREQETEFNRRGETADFGKAAQKLKQNIGIGNNKPEDIASTVEGVRKAEAKEETSENIDFEAAYRNDDDTEVLLADVDPKNEETEILTSPQESGEQISESKLEEQVYAPLINRILKSGVLDAKQAQEIKEGLAAGGDFRETIQSTEGVDPELQQHIIDRWGELNSEKGAEKFTQQFKKDFGAELSNNLDDKKEFTLDSLNYIAPNYVSAGDQANPEEKEEALNMAMQIGINSFLEGKQFERTEAFEIDLQNVKNPDMQFHERVQAFESIIKQMGIDQGSKSLKTKASQREAQESIKRGAQEKIEFAQAQLEVAQKSGDILKIERAKAQLEAATRGEKEEVETGDAKVLGGGKLDIGSEKNQETPAKAA